MNATCLICGSGDRGQRLALGAGPALCDSDWHEERYAGEAEALADALPPYGQALTTESLSVALRRERDEANELCDKIAVELRLVTRERDSLARRCAVRFEETQAVKAELDAERDKRAEDIAAYERACGLAVVAEQERDEALAVQKDAIDAFIRISDQCGLLKAELVSARTELDAVRTARDNLERARSWVVARDGGYTCDWCGQGIRRGEAYEHTHGVDEYRHVHCRTEEPT